MAFPPWGQHGPSPHTERFLDDVGQHRLDGIGFHDADQYRGETGRGHQHHCIFGGCRPSSGSDISVRIRASSRQTMRSACSRSANILRPTRPNTSGWPSTLIDISAFIAFLSFDSARPDDRVASVSRNPGCLRRKRKGCGRRMGSYPHPRRVIHHYPQSSKKGGDCRNDTDRNERRQKTQSRRQEQSNRQFRGIPLDLRALIPIQLFDSGIQSVQRRGPA